MELRWPALPRTPTPEPREVLVLAADLDDPPPDARALLSPAERTRADAYVAPSLRERWTAARAFTRLALGAALGAEPRALTFREGEHGKPSCDGLEFNVSHSGALLLVAVAQRVVGVDCEQHKDRRHDDVARRFFTASEVQWLERHPGGFYEIWSAKEAFIKATGRGLAQGLSSFEFDFDDAGPVALRWQADDPGAAARWGFHRLDPADGFSAALVVEGHDALLRCYRLRTTP